MRKEKTGSHTYTHTQKREHGRIEKKYNDAFGGKKEYVAEKKERRTLERKKH